MRKLNLEETINKVNSMSTDVEFSDKQFYLSKLIQYWNFYLNQPRLKNIFDRIENDYLYIGKQLQQYQDRNLHPLKDYFYKELNTTDKQGAFGYFVIKRVKDNSNWEAPFNFIDDIFYTGTSYDESKGKFNEVFFNPFKELVIDYLEEAKSEYEDDYFSRIEILEKSEKIDEIIDRLNELSLGNEIIYEELQDLKEQLNMINKKNFTQLLKGKLIDIALTIGMKESIRLIYKTITGDDLQLLK